MGKESSIDGPKFVILFGPPGAGKGTQAELLRARLGLAHVASGDFFRENVAKQTPLGKLAKAYLDRGELVPDDVTVLEEVQRRDLADPVDQEAIAHSAFGQDRARHFIGRED